MEGQDGTVRGSLDLLVKQIKALDRLCVKLIAAGTRDAGGGRGVRLKE